MTEKFFHAIINSSLEFPPQLRSVCHCLYQVCLQWLPAPDLWGWVLCCSSLELGPAVGAKGHLLKTTLRCLLRDRNLSAGTEWWWRLRLAAGRCLKGGL